MLLSKLLNHDLSGYNKSSVWAYMDIVYFCSYIRHHFVLRGFDFLSTLFGKNIWVLSID